MKSIQPSIEEALHLSGNCPPSPQYPSSGSVAIPMTNDYLFRAFLQRNNKALKGLSGALLHLKPEEIISVEITNPIVLGNSTNDKTFILDIRVCLNNYAIINLEMQVVNQHNWKERSLSYLCRNFDHLESGEVYEDIRPVIQIGILNFTLIEEYPEFYATYQLLNVKNHTLYSDKLRLSVLDLTRIDLATEKDKDHQLDYWASLFKSTTWEEITMLAEKNEYIAEAATTIYQLSQDEQIRMECEAREDFYRTQLSIQRKLAKLGLLESTTEELESAKEYLESVNKLLESQNESLASQRHALELQNQSLVSQKLDLESQNQSLVSQKMNLESQNQSLVSQKLNLESQNQSLVSQKMDLESQNQSLVSQKLDLESQNQILKSTNNALESKTKLLESQMEQICAWARKHGYDPDSTL